MGLYVNQFLIKMNFAKYRVKTKVFKFCSAKNACCETYEHIRRWRITRVCKCCDKPIMLQAAGLEKLIYPKSATSCKSFWTWNLYKCRLAEKKKRARELKLVR